MRHVTVLLVSLPAAFWTGCVVKTEDPPPARQDNRPLSEVRVDPSTCGAVERTFALEASPHVAACSPVSYGTNPPSSGPHYDAWAAYKTYEEAVPRGYWVHSLEHGAVVISYSCTDCDDEIEAARQAVEAVGVDPDCCNDELCLSSVSRVILTPDPLLDVPWAASSWGRTLTADCFEPAVFQSFILHRRGFGDESVCSDGTDLSNSPC
jgi:hypothetical protein